MEAIVLAATHERAMNSTGKEVPQPLLDLGKEPLLTALINRLEALPGLKRIAVVTNEAIRGELDRWSSSLGTRSIPVEVISDGTVEPAERLGAVGDLLFALDQIRVSDDLLVIGGDNWFTYDIADFVSRAKTKSPAVAVTQYQKDWKPNRFGAVRLGEASRIIEFLEKSKSDTASHKASCVYFFSSGDVSWIRAFGMSHPTRCSPGTLFQWLVGQTPVYGIEMQAQWYDLGQSSGKMVSGPDTLVIRNKLRELVHPVLSTWERVALHSLKSVSSVSDLIEVLHDSDPNLRIVAASLLSGLDSIMSDNTKKLVIQHLKELLGDKSQNITAHDGFEGDDETIEFVNQSAAEALIRLGYAPTRKAVIERAVHEGVACG